MVGDKCIVGRVKQYIGCSPYIVRNYFVQYKKGIVLMYLVENIAIRLRPEFSSSVIVGRKGFNSKDLE
jgi:hypothetical protein